jgi:hypothetical protein
MQTKSSKGLPIRHHTKSEWSEVTPGERFSIRVSSEETNGAYTMLEVIADHRNGTPMHVHQNEDEHFNELFRTTAKGGDHNIAAILDKFGTTIVGPALFDNIYTRFSPRS